MARSWIPFLAALTLVAAACGQPAARAGTAQAHAAAPAATAAPVDTSAPSPAPSPRPAAISHPSRFLIPRLGIGAEVEAVDWLGVPVDPNHVGWFRTNPAPGEPGAAVFDGHLDWTTGPAVFWHLKEITTGDKIQVMGAEGSLEFTVDRVASVDVSTSPPPWLYQLDGTPAISIITCDGYYTTGGYNQRLLVHGVLTTL